MQRPRVTSTPFPRHRAGSASTSVSAAKRASLTASSSHASISMPVAPRGAEGGLCSPSSRRRGVPRTMRGNLLFDLDGTLTDPREGIVGSLRHALAELGVPAPSDDELSRFIGPPL